jgi:hypothetical protein
MDTINEMINEYYILPAPEEKQWMHENVLEWFES